MSTGTELQRTDQPGPVVFARNFLDKRSSQIAKWVRGGVQPEALVRFALQDMQMNAKLREATPESIYLALLACAVSGLEPGSLKQEAFLVPFARNIGTPNSPRWIQEAKFMAGWRGLRKQAVRSGGVKMVHTGVVYEHDTFDYDLGTSAHLTHKPGHRNRGELLGAYAWARLTNGEPQIEWVTAEDLEKIQKFAESKNKSPAWQQWGDEMRRKSALRRLAKYLPMDETYYNGQRIESAHESHEDGEPSDAEVINIITEGDALLGSGEAMTEAAAFAPAPQPNKPAKAAAAKPAANKPPIDTSSAERPTAAAAAVTASAAAPSNAAPATVTTSTTPASAPAAVSPTTPAAIPSSAGAPSPAASPATPAPGSAPSSDTAPPSTSSTSTTQTTSDGSAFDGEGDTSFDTSSFGDEDPVDTAPPEPFAPPVGVPTREQLVGLASWAKTADPASIKAARAQWLEAFKAWVASTKTQKEMNEHKQNWLDWAAANFRGPKRASGNVPAMPGDPETVIMQTTFAGHFKGLPVS